jgi:hypothetical protein
LSVSTGEPIKLNPEISLEAGRLAGSSREELIGFLAESAVRLKTLEEKLRGAELENRYLRELLRLARIEKYGPGSEKLSDEQLALLELEPGVSQAEVQPRLNERNSSCRFAKQLKRPSILVDSNYPHTCPGSKRLSPARQNSASAPNAEKIRN